MLEELYVAVGVATLVYYLVTKTKRGQVQIEITPLQPPDPPTPLSPMSVCSDLMEVAPLQFKEDYMDIDSTQNKTT